MKRIMELVNYNKGRNIVFFFFPSNLLSLEKKIIVLKRMFVELHALSAVDVGLVLGPIQEVFVFIL